VAEAIHRIALSVDLDEWYHSSRWLDGQQAVAVPNTQALFKRVYGQDRPAGDVIEPTRWLLDLLDRYRVRCTFFVLGEMALWYPDLVRDIARTGHEIGCHGMHHVDMTVLGPETFSSQLRQASDTIEAVTGVRPVGYRAPNLVYEPWATRILESQGFVYDTSVCVSRSIGGKYRGWARAPIHPYRPAYDNIATPGPASLIELPLPPFPLIRLSAGSGIMTRVIGFSWSALALEHAVRTGDTAYYFHPWEIAEATPRQRGSLKSALFLRRTGPWMRRAVERLLQRFDGRIVTAGEAASRLSNESRI
jgi:peptidoglycan/xylan/chitin deacetylase (PgdA/CDA1 family)